MSSTPPPKPTADKGSGSSPPGLVRRKATRGIADAIPTEAEGDALFDKLFGDEDPFGDADDTPAPDFEEDAATVMVDRSQFAGTPLGLGPEQAPVQPRPPLGPPPGGIPGATGARDEDEDHETFRPPAPTGESAPPPLPSPGNPGPLPAGPTLGSPTLGEAALGQAGLHQGGIDPTGVEGGVDDSAETGEHKALVVEDLIDTNQYPKADFPHDLEQTPTPLPSPPEDALAASVAPATALGDAALGDAALGDAAAGSDDDIAFEDGIAVEDVAVEDVASEDDGAASGSALATDSDLGTESDAFLPADAELVDDDELVHDVDSVELVEELSDSGLDPSSVNFADAIRPVSDDPLGAMDSVAEEEAASYSPAASPSPGEVASAAVEDVDELEDLADGDRASSAIVNEGAEVMDLDADEIAAIEAAEAELADAPSATEGGPAFSYVDADGAGNDAVVSLMQQGERDAWVDRATWLYDEAPDAGDPTDRARALLVVAELLAMAGEEERAETVAREALQLAPSLPMAHRQLRGILMARGRWTEAADALDAECRVAPTNGAKLHAAYLGAEVARLVQGDPQGCSRRLDTAERVGHGDVRVPLARLMQSLASADDVPAVPAAGSGTASVSAALEVLRAIRSDGASGNAGASPYGSLLRARASLRKHDVASSVEALGELEQVEEFGAGASWLISALAAPHAALRPEAVKALARVSDGSHGAVATRARAARALELGDAEVVSQLANEAADDVLSATERLILASLAGASLEDPNTWLEQAADAEPALASAAAAVLNATTVELGDPSAVAGVLLGRALARATTAERTNDGSDTPDKRVADGDSHDDDSLHVPIDAVVKPSAAPQAPANLPSDLVSAASRLLEADGSDGVARAVLLENSFAAGDISKVAAALSNADAEGFEVERSLAAALLAELAGDYEHMERELESVLASQPDNEAAMRMTMVIAEPVIGAASLARFANSVEGDVRAAIALNEAGLRLMEEDGQEADGEALLRSAADKAPDLPVAAFIGLYVAQALGDSDGEEFWFEQRRRAAVEPADGVMDNVRHAVRISADAMAERASVLEEAHRARPNDYCLRELYEQAAGVADDRAAWLMDRAGDDADASAAPLALEAALASELDGDLELAARCARRAAELGDTQLAPIFARRFALRGHGADDVLEKLHSDVRAATEPELRAELLEVIAQVQARGRGDQEKAKEALRSILREQPTHVATLHELEAMALADGDVSDLADVCMSIAKTVEGSACIEHAMMAARLIHASGGWDDTFDAVQLAFKADNPNLWSMRQMAAHARARGDHATAAGIDCTLAERTDQPIDRATLLLRGAEASLASGDNDAAAGLLDEVVELWPRHQIGLLQRGALMVAAGKAEEAAQIFEELGMVCQSPGERCSKLYKAATLWLSLESSESQDEGRRLLEAVSTVDADYEDTFDRLQAIYLAAGAKRELADLLAARLENVTDPDERVEIEVMRGRMLVEAGSAGEAREALQAALDANPDNPDALSAFADVCAAEGEWEQVEQSIIRLGRLVSEPDKQCEIYLRLGALYDEHLPNPERAEMAYQEVLKRAPENTKARGKLVELYLAAGEPQRAFEQQQEVITAANSPADKCTATVKLAEIHEASGDPKLAEKTLVKARRTWNKDAAPVMALYRFYKRTGQDPAADILLDRASADVRRGLGAGRFEAPLFAMATAVADLRGQADAAQIAKATLGAITGEATYIEGGGLMAGQPELDDHTAPDVLTASFRQLLRATGDIMDEAAPFDLKSLRTKPLPPPNADVIERTREIAAAYGLPNVQVVATNALGQVCMPAQSEPPTLCFGLALVTAERTQVREFLVHRALKVLQTRTAALSRTAPIDLWPLVAAYLQLHSPSFKPQGVDTTKVNNFRSKMEAAMPPPDPQLSLLASEVIGSIGNRASSLNTITNSWGSRTALLAMGDPNLALEAIAWATGNAQGPPSSGTDRVRWIGRQAEARDLIVFSVSEGYAAARNALGIDSALIESVDFIEVQDD